MPQLANSELRMDRQRQHEARRSHAHITRLRRVRLTRPCPSMTSPSSWRFATKSPVPSPGASLRRRQMGRRHRAADLSLKGALCSLVAQLFLNRLTVKKLLHFLAITFIHFLSDRHFDLTVPVERSPSRLSGHPPSLSSSPGHGSRDFLPSERDRPAIWRAFFA